jgi:hypothetical protein
MDNGEKSQTGVTDFTGGPEESAGRYWRRHGDVARMEPLPGEW